MNLLPYLARGALAGGSIALAVIGMFVWVLVLIDVLRNQDLLTAALFLVATGTVIGAIASYTDYRRDRARAGY